ncbi:MAG: polymorphic toxin type 17 domain-containing protein [Pseudomonadota bacterium]
MLRTINKQIIYHFNSVALSESKQYDNSLASEDLTDLQLIAAKQSLKKYLTNNIDFTIRAKSNSDAKKQFEKFKIILGPLDKSISVSQQKDTIDQLSFDLIKTQSCILIWDAINTDLESCERLFKNIITFEKYKKLLISYKRNDNNSHTDEIILSQHQELIDSHQAIIAEVFESGFDCYQTWCWDNQIAISQIAIDINTSRNEILLDESIKENIKKLLSSNIEKSLENNCWEKIYHRADNITYRISDQILYFLPQVFKVFEKILLNATNLSELFESFHTQTNVFLKVVETTLQKQNDLSKNTTAQENIVLLEKYISDWFEAIKREVFLDIKQEKINAKVNYIIKNKSLKAWQLTSSDINELYNLICQITIPEIRQQYIIEFEKRYPNQGIISVLEQSAARLIADRDVNDLEAIIKRPLQWYQLNICLGFFDARSELQLAVKKYLRKYLEQQIKESDLFLITTAGNNNDLEIRRYIEYLISCLYMAKCDQVDVGILFNASSSKKNTKITGINIILNKLKSCTTEFKSFAQGFESIYQEANYGLILCLRPPSSKLGFLSDSVDLKAKELNPLTAAESYQLYWKYYNKFLYSNNVDSETKFGYLYEACCHLLQASIDGNVAAQSKLQTFSDETGTYKFIKQLNNEFYTQLLQINKDSEDYNNAQWYLFKNYLQRYETTFYHHYGERLQDIVIALKYLIKVPEQKFIDVKDISLNSVYKDNKIAWYILLNELIGNQFLSVDKEKHVSYPFRLMSTEKFYSLLDDSIADSPEKETLLQEILSSFKQFRKNFKRLLINSDRENHYTIIITAQDFEKIKKPYISYIDEDTKEEIARFESVKGQLIFRSYGSDISLQMDGVLQVPSFVIENSGATTILSANFDSKQLTISGKVGKLIFEGNINVALLSWEMLGAICIAESATIVVDKSAIKLHDLEVHSSIYSKSAAYYEIKNRFRLGGASKANSDSKTLGKLLSNGLIQINAGKISKIYGEILSANLIVKTKDTLYLGSQSWLQAKNLLEMHAPALISSASNIRAQNEAKLVITNNIVVNKKSNWQIKKFSLQAGKMENRSQLLNFDTAVLTVPDIINYQCGIITTKKLLQIRGDTVVNTGQIIFGNQLNAALNKYFVHGLVDLEDLREDLADISKSYKRPSLSGKSAVIVTGAYINLFGKVTTSAFSLTAVAEFTLGGLTNSTNKIKSRIFSMDLGLDVPNVTEIFSDLNTFIRLNSQGEFQSALEMLCTSGAMFKGSQFVSWLFKTFIPALGAPIDLVWTIFSVVTRTPQLINQIYTLHQQNTIIQYHQLYSLINTGNSLATQGVFLEGRLIGLSHGLPPIQISVPPVVEVVGDIAALALPYSSDTALFNLEGGLHISPSLSSRSLFSINDFNAKFGLNISETFFFTDQRTTLSLANNYSQVGERAYNSGAIIASTITSNVNHEVEAGIAIARSINRNAQEFKEEKSSSTKAETYTLIGEKESLEGSNQVDRLAMIAKSSLHTSGTIKAHDVIAESEQSNFSGDTETTNFNSHSTSDTETHGHLRASHANVSSDTKVKLDAQIEIVEEKTDSNNSDAIRPSLKISADEVISESSIEDKDGEVVLIAKKTAYLSKDIQADVLVVEADESITDKAHLKVHQADLESKKQINYDGTAEFASPASDNYLRMSADHVAMAAESSVSGEGTLSIHAKTGTLANISVDNFDLVFSHIPQIEDLIQQTGIYKNIKFTKGVSVGTSDAVKLDRKLDLPYSVEVTGSSVDIEADIHSSNNISFTSTCGNIHIGEHKVVADHYLQFDSHGDLVGDSSHLMGYEIAINALKKVVDNGGQWVSENYFNIKAGDDVEVNCLSSDVQGDYDTKKSYQPGYLIGGVGKDHEGVGLFVQTDGKFILLGSSVYSQGSNDIYAKKGIDLEALYHKYISYYREYHNWTGRKSETIDYSFQLQPAVLYSQNGSNSLFSSDGSIYSVSAEFYAAKENNLTAKHDIKLLGYVLEEREYKDRRNLYVSDKKTDQRDEVAIPTAVIAVANTNITSTDGNIEQTNAFISSGGKLTETAENIRIAAPVLKHSLKVETSGVTFSTPIMSGTSSQPIAQDFQGLNQAKDAVAFSAGITNTVLDSLNFANTVLTGIRNGSFVKGVLQASNLISAQVGYQHSKTTVKSESIADNVGVDAGEVVLKASQSVSLIGVTTRAAGDFTIKTHHLIQRGEAVHSSMENQTEQIAAGMAMSGDPSMSASVSVGTSESVEYENQNVLAGGTYKAVVDIADLTDVTVEAKNIEVDAKEFNMTTSLGESSSEQSSVSASTSGQIDAKMHSTHTKTIHEATTLHARDHLEVKTDSATIVGGKVISDGDGKFTAKTLHCETEYEEKSSHSLSLSANVNDLGSLGQDKAQDDNQDPSTNYSSFIPTETVSVGNASFSAKQESTIHFASGTPNIQSITPGSSKLNKEDASGYSVQRDKESNVTLKVPISIPTVEQYKNTLEGAKAAMHPHVSTIDGPKSSSEDQPPAALLTSSVDTAWVNSKTASYAQSVFQTPSYPTNSTTSPDQGTSKARSTGDEEEKIFPTESSQLSTSNIGIPDPRASNLGFFGKSYRPSMPASSSANYATVDVGIFEEGSETSQSSYESANDYVNNPRILDVVTHNSSFQSGTSDYLDQVQFTQEKDAAAPMTFENKTTGEKLKNLSEATFNIDNVDSFNAAAAASREGLVHAISNPRETIENIAITYWDTLNGVSEIVTGSTTKGAHDRNVVRGKAYHEVADEFQYGTTADRVGIVTGVVSNIIYTEAIGVPLVIGVVKTARVGMDTLPSLSKTTPKESLGKMPESIPDNQPERISQSDLSSKLEKEPVSTLPSRATGQRLDVSSEEIGETTLPKNDRQYPPNPSTPAFSGANAYQSRLLNQHGLFNDGVSYSEPLKKVAGSDAQFHHVDEAGSNSYVINRQYEETMAGTRRGSGKGRGGDNHSRHGKVSSESSSSGSTSHGGGTSHVDNRPVNDIEIPEAIKKAQLPYQIGDFPFKPPKKWRPHMDLVRGDRGGYMDADGNEWVKGDVRGYRNRNNLQDKDTFEWDVQIPQKNYIKYKHLLKDKKHINVSKDGIITHNKNPDVTPSGRKK